MRKSKNNAEQEISNFLKALRKLTREKKNRAELALLLRMQLEPIRRAHFESWTAAAKAARIPKEMLFVKPKALNKNAVVRLLIKRKQAGLSMKSIDIQKDAYLLHRSILYHFTTLRDAFKSAKISPPTRVRYPTPKSVLEGIQERKRRRKSLKTVSMHSVRSAGGDINLYQMGRYFFGSWRNAVEKAGFDPNKVLGHPRHLPEKYPTKASVIKELQRRAQNRLSLSSQILCLSRKKEEFDSPLYRSAMKHFKNWHQAKKIAGVLDIEKENKLRARK